eukprot:GHVT01070071.1.p1 GENE.GHVT01070071.1~~GHVT01070071.1.p1  ORF type:complete len:573 (-),score=54.21 GHVT01070071.1:286-2004(-)
MVKEGGTFYAFRGGGPFGSIGVPLHHGTNVDSDQARHATVNANGLTGDAGVASSSELRPSLLEKQDSSHMKHLQSGSLSRPETTRRFSTTISGGGDNYLGPGSPLPPTALTVNDIGSSRTGSTAKAAPHTPPDGSAPPLAAAQSQSEAPSSIMLAKGQDSSQSALQVDGNKTPTRTKLSTPAQQTTIKAPPDTDLPKLHNELASTSIPMRQMKDSQYVGVVGVGTPRQLVRPIFDTGSGNLWVVGESCTKQTCTKVRQYDKTKSTSYSPLNPAVALDITFGTGQIHGTMGTETFEIGPYVINQQTFGIIEDEGGYNIHGNIFEQIDFEGIVGLAFPEMSSTGDLLIYDHVLQAYPKLAGQNSNEFAFSISESPTPSAIFFGGVDPRFFEPPIHMFPVVREHYWETQLSEFWVGDVKFCCDQPEKQKSYVIFDSGTSFNTLPGHEIMEFFKLVPPRTCTDENLDQVLQSFPDLTYVLQGVSIVVRPSEYIVRSNDDCRSAYMQIDVPSEFGHAYLLGSLAFMRHYFTVFRRGDGHSPSMVGIAKARTSPESANYLQDVLNGSPGGQLLNENAR